MANIKSAAKRARQTVNRTVANRRATTAIKTQVKKTHTEIQAGRKEQAAAEFRKLNTLLDRAAKTGRMHRNAANRRKSRMNKALAALG